MQDETFGADPDAKGCGVPSPTVKSRKVDGGWRVTRAIEVLLYAPGAGSFAEVNPLQRIWRDSATAARQAIVSPHSVRKS